MMFACVTFVSFLLLTKVSSGTGSLQQPVVACFLQSWAVYRPSHGQFSVEDVDTSLCTHAVYCFVGLDIQTNRIVSLDKERVRNGAFRKLVGLKQSNPSLVVTVSVGGWVEGSEKYSKMAASNDTRKTFVESVVEYIRNHSLDGLNLYWNDPSTRGGSSEDKENYVLLCKELSEAFRQHGWHLTATVSAQQPVLGTGYDLREIVKYVDLVYVRATDYHGYWNWYTGHVAPLYPRVDEDGIQKQLNVNSTLSSILSLRVPPEKLVLMLPLFGRTFFLRDASDNGFGAISNGSGFAGPYTEEDGLLGYNEICELLSTEVDQWTVHRAEGDAGPYAVSGNKWFSFDDSLSISKKVELVRATHLAGMAVMGVDNDDFGGHCGGGSYPLLTQIKNQLVDGIVVSQEDNPSLAAVPEKKPLVKACFLEGESLKRESLGKFAIEGIDASLCTHIVFCYAILNEATGRIDDKDSYFGKERVYTRLLALKVKNPDLLVVVAIGGWEDGALKYSKMASNATSRATFVESVVTYLKQNNLDGLNLDWQDPATRGGSIELDKQNYVLLCEDLSTAFAEYGWQLTVSVSAHKHVLDDGYDLPGLAAHADLLFVSTYAYHGPWEEFTGHTAPLYSRDDEQGNQRFLNINYTLSYILAEDVPSRKVVPAIPFLFRTYNLLNPRNDNIGADTTKEGFSGPYTQLYSLIAYHEICNYTSGWEKRYELQQQVPYMVKGEKWLGYENNESIREKLILAGRYGVGGVMVWTIDADDFTDSCGQGRYPLLSAVNREMPSAFGAVEAATTARSILGPATSPTAPGSTAVPPDEDLFLTDEGTSAASRSCYAGALKEVALDILTCGHEDSNCVEGNRVPARTVVYAVCWNTVTMVLSCHQDGYWRPYSEAHPSHTDAGNSQENDGGKMRVICHPQYVNSAVCGQRSRYWPNRASNTNLGDFLKPVDRHPWVVGVMKDSNHTCTATLISPLHALTAAHCVDGGQPGAVDANNLHVQIGSVFANVVDIRLHPDFRLVHGSRYSNDIALLRLEKPVEFHSKLYPACVNFNPLLMSTTSALVFQYAKGNLRSDLNDESIDYSETIEEFDSSCHSPHQAPCYFGVEFESTVFCGVTPTSNESLHHGSPGSPFLQNFGNKTDERWTVSGVVSRVDSSGKCAQRVTVLSAVHAYGDWITGVVKEHL